MRIVKMSEVKKELLISPLFTDSDVTKQTLFPDSKEKDLKVVNFGKGVRNKFNAHD